MLHKAIFLDRDGTLIQDKGYVHRSEDFMPTTHAVAGLKEMMAMDFLLVVVTNQSGIARGMFSESHLRQFHQYMRQYFAARAVFFSAIYYCPHLAEAPVARYRKDCACRKPKPGLFLRAIKELEIDPKRSYTVGDSARDIVAGRRAGTRTILLRDKARASGCTPDFVAPDLLAAANLIANDPRRGARAVEWGRLEIDCAE